MFQWLLLHAPKIWQFTWVGVVAVTACSSGETISNQVSLRDTSWILTGLGTVDAPTVPIPGSEITAVFSPTHLSGTSGCNRYGSPYDTNGSSIQISEIAATAMDCPTPLMEQEAQFLEALPQATTFSVTEDELVMETAVSTLTFRKLQPLPLEGTSWHLAGIAQDGVVIETWMDEGITAVFANGTLSGKTGCNDYSGSYRQDGDSVALSEIGSSKIFCDDERNQREIQFLTALKTAVRYTTSLHNLTLLDTDNNILLTFSKAPPPNPLSGVTWKLVALETPDGPLSTQGSLITAQFMKELVTGTGGCNPYAAGYFLAADAYLLLLNNIDHGFENCTGPVQQLEAAFFSLMETAESFTIDNNTLTIFSTRGTLSFVITPSPATN